MSVVAAFISPGMVHAHFASSLLSVSIAEPRLRGVLNVGGVPRTTNMNEMISQFLESDAEWYWHVDTDMIFPSDSLTMLLETAEKLNRRIVSGVYFDDGGLPVFSMGRVPNGDLAKLAPTQFGNMTHIEVAETGEGCLLVHRSILEEMGPPWWLNGYDPVTAELTYEEKWFYSRTEEKPMVDLRVRCGHIKLREITYESVMREKQWENE